MVDDATDPAGAQELPKSPRETVGSPSTCSVASGEKTCADGEGKEDHVGIVTSWLASRDEGCGESLSSGD